MYPEVQSAPSRITGGVVGIAQMWEGKRLEGVQLGLMGIKLKEAMYEEWDLFKEQKWNTYGLGSLSHKTNPKSKIPK